MTGKKIYIAGPMRGIPLFNFPAFDAARDYLISSRGWTVISPADMDRAAGFDPATCQVPPGYDWHDTSILKFEMSDAVDRDLAAIKECDAIYMLDGWQNSTGATAEKAVAEWRGKRVIYQTQVQKAEPPILDVAKAITGGDRQASYGPPDQDFRRTAAMWSGLFAHMLRDGERFEPSHVAQAMILLKCSRQLHQRKRDNWIDIAGYAHCGAVCDEAKDAALLDYMTRECL